MSARLIRLGIWVLVIGYACLQSLAVQAQDTTHTLPPSSPTEIRDVVALYFPPGTFKRPDGSLDDSRADMLALYLREIGEPPLFRSGNNSEAHAYRLIWTGFPAGRTVVLRLQVDSHGTAKIFAKQTSFDGTNLQVSNERDVSLEAANRFLECVKRGGFWQLPTRQESEPRVNDGTYWVLEGVRHGEYHLVYRRAPERNPGPFTDIGRYLAKDLGQLGDSVNIPPGDQPEPIRRHSDH